MIEWGEILTKVLYLSEAAGVIFEKINNVQILVAKI